MTRQCALLKLPRSTAYYKPGEFPQSNLDLMKRIDELHFQWPFAGSRMMRNFLKCNKGLNYSIKMLPG